MLFSLASGVEAMVSAETSKQVKSEPTEKIPTRSSKSSIQPSRCLPTLDITQRSGAAIVEPNEAREILQVRSLFLQKRGTTYDLIHLERNPPPRTTTLPLLTVSLSSRCLLCRFSSSPSVEASKSTTDRPSSLLRSSVFSHLLRQKKDRNPPRTTTVMLLTASPPSLLVFSGRRTMQTHLDDECLGPHGVASVGLSALAHNLYNLEITFQVINFLTSFFCFQFHKS
ncbi:hypothetical protein Bca4012_051548 [Brassica carinata]